jgi:hypothetical protein
MVEIKGVVLDLHIPTGIENRVIAPVVVKEATEHIQYLVNAVAHDDGV